MSESSQDIARFIKTVQYATSAAKIDLVGHSEGAMQVLYTAKFGNVSSVLEHLVAIAPPTHGISAYGLYHMVPSFLWNAAVNAFKIIGCDACADMLRHGPAAEKLDDGNPIAQPGNKVTIIASKLDQGVTPPSTASFVNEKGVENIYVQDYCPLDPVGHYHEPVDTNIYNLVLNSLEDQVGRKFTCSIALPLK